MLQAPLRFVILRSLSNYGGCELSVYFVFRRFVCILLLTYSCISLFYYVN